ncbi:hypothetical protein NLJ89_g10159 [Agrocybe chaxingu]|uniref:Uncharacterized protein n=1 Tax=Agrocybe chaxingu TaxID=84603 RepID=A0A9W8JS85_9AGAR|nr:hypothetical protein NLJ89_g10159 [Agrocybe chaxingu]
MKDAMATFLNPEPVDYEYLKSLVLGSDDELDLEKLGRYLNAHLNAPGLYEEVQFTAQERPWDLVDVFERCLAEDWFCKWCRKRGGHPEIGTICDPRDFEAEFTRKVAGQLGIPVEVFLDMLRTETSWWGGTPDHTVQGEPPDFSNAPRPTSSQKRQRDETLSVRSLFHSYRSSNRFAQAFIPAKFLEHLRMKHGITETGTKKVECKWKGCKGRNGSKLFQADNMFDHVWSGQHIRSMNAGAIMSDPGLVQSKRVMQVLRARAQSFSG